MEAKLFGSRLSPFVEKVARALQLKGIAFTLVPPKSPTDFKRWNAQTRKMPVVEIDGRRVFDSTLILRRLDQLVPEPPLFDRDAGIAARQRFLEDWSDESLYWYVMALRWADANAEATTTQVLGSIPAPAALRPVLRVLVRRQFRSQALGQGLARLPLETIVDELGRRFDELLVWLGDRPYFFADRPSAADLALFGQLNGLQSGPTPQAERLVAERPRLADYFLRVDAVTADRRAEPGHRAGRGVDLETTVRGA
jgi:glutathione S-transferase